MRRLTFPNLEATSPTRRSFANARSSPVAEMASWPVDHHFKFATIDITDIWLIDMFGGARLSLPPRLLLPEDRDKRGQADRCETPEWFCYWDKVGTARWLAHETTSVS